MKKIGKQTIKFDNPPTITECSSIVGPKESQGPLAKYFDQTLDDEFWGEKTWEKAESKIIKETVTSVINKSGIPSEQIDCCFAGDLLNQCISSSFGLRELNIPFFGVFGACSTFVESMSLASQQKVLQPMLYVLLLAIFVVQKNNLDFHLNLEISVHQPHSGQLQEVVQQSFLKMVKDHILHI